MNYVLKELLNISRLSELLDSLDEIQSMPSAIIDTEGNILTAMAWNENCSKFHRIHPHTQKLCIEDPRQIGATYDEKAHHTVYRCPMGLVNSTMAIIIEGKHLGNVFSGQLFIEPPDESYLFDQARQNGFDEIEYLAAMRKIPIFPEEKLHKYLTIIKNLVQMLVEHGLQHKRELESNEVLQQRNAELQLSELKFRSYIDNSPDGVFIADETGRYLEVNRAATVITGYSESELLNMSISDLIAPESIEIAMQGFQTLKDTGSITHEYSYLPKNGNKCWWSVEAVKLSDTRFLGFTKDITKRKMAEVELRESEEEHRVLFETADDMIFVHNEIRLLAANPEASRKLGYTHTELMSMSIAELDAPGEDLHAPERIALVMEHGHLKFETVHQRKDGSLVPIDVSARKVIWRGQSAIMSICRDITERKKADAEHCENEEQYRAILQAAMDGFLLTDMKGRFLETNEAYCHMIGYSEQELLNMSILDIDSAMTTDDVAGAMQSFINREGGIRFETEQRRKDGTIINVEISVHYRSFGGGRLVNFLRDITARKRAEEQLSQYNLNLAELVKERTNELRKSEERFRSFVENANDIVFSLSSEGIFTYVSPNWKDAFGYELAETVGKAFVPFVHPEDVATCFSALKLVFETKEKQNDIEYRVLHKNGTWIWYAANGSLLFDSENNEVTFLGIGRDISYRKLADEALRESEEKFRLLYESAGDSISVIDMQANILTVNPMACKMLGYTYDEMIALPVTKIDRDPQLAGPRIELVLRNGHNTFDTEHVRKDGSIVWVSIDSRLITWDGQPAILNNVRDISERKKAEEEKLLLERQLLHAQKLESLGIMAGGIAHDFNNLLQSILGNMELASRNLDPESATNKLISNAMISGKQATHLTNLMLAYAGKGFIDKKGLNLNDLVRNNSDILRSATTTAISLELHLSAELPAIIADEAQIQQLVMNLITNAAESIDTQPGFVKISTGVKNCDQTFLATSLLVEKPEPGRYVFLEVSDNGCGMNEETINRLFDPFFTTKFTGRGLGMSAVMGIMKTYSGALLVKSQLGKGTTFMALFPVSESALPITVQESVASPQVERTVTEKPLSGLVLVVDDEKSVLKTCTKMVKLCGFRVLTAIDGIDAVAKFREQADEIDLVLMDLTMPNMDGITAMKEIYSIRPDTKVLLASGFNKDELSERISSQPPSGFIRKPYSMNELVTELRRVMQPE